MCKVIRVAEVGSETPIWGDKSRLNVPACTVHLSFKLDDYSNAIARKLKVMFACAQHDSSPFNIRLWEVSYLVYGLAGENDQNKTKQSI